MATFFVLIDGAGRKHAVNAEGKMARSRGLGTLDVEKLKSSIGRKLTIGNRSFVVLRPSLRDLLNTMPRGPQIITPKDLAVLLFESDIGPGSRVLEAGAGSGSLTAALARAVGETGMVISYDLRRDALTLAESNVARTGFVGNVDFRLGDIRRGVPDRDLDAVLLDLGDPWAAVASAWDALRSCGSLTSISPNMEQVKETVASIRKLPFVDIRTIELIEREIEVREVGVRPSFAALGHTGYLTFARKVLETV